MVKVRAYWSIFGCPAHLGIVLGNQIPCRIMERLLAHGNCGFTLAMVHVVRGEARGLCKY